MEFKMDFLYYNNLKISNINPQNKNKLTVTTKTDEYLCMAF